MISKQHTIILVGLLLILVESSCSAKTQFNQKNTPTLIPTPTPTFTSTSTPKPTVSPTITPTPVGGGLGKIAFVSTRDGKADIYIMNSDGSEQIRLTYNSGDNTDPNWSPNGEKIVYISQGNTGGRAGRDIFIINANGGEEINLTKSFPEIGFDEPKWSPDGTKIAYVGCHSYAYESCEIFIMNSDGGEKKQITNNEFEDCFFDWSPDGKQIAFWSLRNKQGDIYVINIDGSDELKLTNNPKYPNHISYNINPSWLPKGKTIIYMSTNFNTKYDEIYAINSDGSDETRITLTQGSEWLISGQQMWSPDGENFTFMYRSQMGDQIVDKICVMNSNSIETDCITDGPDDDNPRWSPDGKKIAFISYRDGQPEIYIMNNDGRNQTRLTYSNINESWLSQFQWSP